MKLLFDQNISYRLANKLKDILPAISHVKELGLENTTDKAIWDFAKSNGFTIVTFDSDFYDYSVLWGSPPKIIWIKSFNQSTVHIEQLLRSHSNAITEFDKNIEMTCLEIIGA